MVTLKPKTKLKQPAKPCHAFWTTAGTLWTTCPSSSGDQTTRLRATKLRLLQLCTFIPLIFTLSQGIKTKQGSENQSKKAMPSWSRRLREARTSLYSPGVRQHPAAASSVLFFPKHFAMLIQNLLACSEGCLLLLLHFWFQFRSFLFTLHSGLMSYHIILEHLKIS